MKPLTFWYEFASPYSYFSMMRIDALAAARDVEIIYQPFLLGPLFKAVGWAPTPFLIYEDKGKNFFRDIVREAEFYGLPPIKLLAEFPQSGLWAARVTLVGLEEGWGVDFSKAVYQRQFQAGLPIVDLEDMRAVLGDILDGSIDDVLAKAGSDDIKTRLRAVGERAKATGIFGAPSFVVGDELFWGNDRLERALDYC